MKHNIMVTSFDKHWDNINRNYTGFSTPMLRFRIMDYERHLIDLPTIFVKRKKNGTIEKTWKGTISGLEKKPYKNDLFKWWFYAHIEKEIECSEKLNSYTEGWYIEDLFDANDLIGQSEIPKPDFENFQELYHPPFIHKLGTTRDSGEFEDYTYYLLRLMGVNEIYRFDRANQSGKADGFFKLGKTVIIHDCTLRHEFLSHKTQQIDNYTNLLNSNRIEIDNRTLNITNSEKIVWVIQRSTDSSLIKHVGDVIIKSINIKDIIRLYSQRLKYGWNEKQLESKLQEI